MPPTCSPHLRLSLYIPTPATSNSKRFDLTCTSNTQYNLSSWNDQRPVLGSHLSSAHKAARTTRGCIGCFVSDILSIGRFEQLRRANFNCFDRLGTARVYLSNRPCRAVQHRSRPCQHLQIGIRSGIDLDEVLSPIVSERAQCGTGENSA